MERDHQVYLSISGGEFAGLSKSGDILLPVRMRHRRNSVLTLPNQGTSSGCLLRIADAIPPDRGSGSRKATASALDLRTQIYVLKFAVAAIRRRWRAF